MKRISSLVVAAGAAVAILAVATSGGSAQTSGGRTLTFFEPDRGSSFHFVDHPPRSRTRNVVSPGDQVFFTNLVLDRRGGTRLGRAYGEGSFLRGRRVSRGRLLGHGVLKLRNGSIVIEGVFRSTDRPHTDVAAVTGGTGAYEGASGDFVSRQVRDGSVDTVHLLP